MSKRPIFWDEQEPPPFDGVFVANYIPHDWLDSAFQIHHKNGCIHTIRTHDMQTISLPQRFHRDVEGADVIEANAHLNMLLKAEFPFLKGGHERIGGIVSHLAGAVARKARPFFGRLHEKKAMRGSYGGRSEVFQEQGSCHLVEYDIPSAYPSMSLGLLPGGAPYRVPADAPAREGWLDMVCISAVVQSDIGVLPVRREHDIHYPKEAYILRQWYWMDEIEAAFEYCETVRNFVIHEKVRFKGRLLLQRFMSSLIKLRHVHKEHAKTIKCISNQLIGMFAYRGSKSIIIQTKDGEKIKRGDWLICPERGLWGRRVPTKKHPHTYRPFIPSFIWSQARIALLGALMTTDDPISCHIDNVLASEQATPPLATIAKNDYGCVTYECPWRGALFVNGKRVKAPGIKKGK